LLREKKGELLAEVTSAVVLKASQKKAIEASLKSSLGKKVEIDVKVDERLLGGLVIRLGSTMLDASVSSKLERLRVVGKEAIANV
jgi:F-type H+-transporting ATPase subunit delta